ncbi:transposase [Streptomyces sp. MUM 203J]|uniref:transposase n=1 Tax=Streptomyces sp. MUM 203J TaxID=2791990 RepID=UPI0035AB933E
MTGENVTEAETVESSESQPSKAVDDRPADDLVSRAQAEGLQLTGESGLLQQLTKRLLQSALEGEITDHLGHDRHDPAGKNDGDTRNGTHAKAVLTLLPAPAGWTRRRRSWSSPPGVLPVPAGMVRLEVSSPLGTEAVGV